MLLTILLSLAFLAILIYLRYNKKTSDQKETQIEPKVYSITEPQNNRVETEEPNVRNYTTVTEKPVSLEPQMPTRDPNYTVKEKTTTQKGRKPKKTTDKKPTAKKTKITKDGK